MNDGIFDFSGGASIFHRIFDHPPRRGLDIRICGRKTSHALSLTIERYSKAGIIVSLPGRGLIATPRAPDATTRRERVTLNSSKSSRNGRVERFKNCLPKEPVTRVSDLYDARAKVSAPSLPSPSRADLENPPQRASPLDNSPFSDHPPPVRSEFLIDRIFCRESGEVRSKPLQGGALREHDQL